MSAKINQKKTTSHSTKHRAHFKEKDEEDKDLFQKLNQTLDLNKPFISRDFSIYSTPENKDKEHFKFNTVVTQSMKRPQLNQNKDRYNNDNNSPYKEIPQPMLNKPQIIQNNKKDHRYNTNSVSPYKDIPQPSSMVNPLRLI